MPFTIINAAAVAASAANLYKSHMISDRTNEKKTQSVRERNGENQQTASRYGREFSGVTYVRQFSFNSIISIIAFSHLHIHICMIQINIACMRHTDVNIKVSLRKFQLGGFLLNFLGV